MAPKRDTPAMRQYDAFKRSHPDCVLFFRMGDFYEMFDEDAVTAHRALGITLTERTSGIPMAGVPHHAVESYLRRMIEQGFRVAVCDQIQDPKDAKGVVERAVTRILTPGTLVDEALLEADAPNVLAAAGIVDGDAALATVELSTGGFEIATCPARELADALARCGAAELLLPEDADGTAPAEVEEAARRLALATTRRDAWQFRPEEALELLRGHYGVSTLAGFGIADDDPAIGVAGALLRYLVETQAIAAQDDGALQRRGVPAAIAAELRGRSLGHLAPPRRRRDDGVLRIDAASLRALEVERTLRGGDLDGSLSGVFLRGESAPATPMGRRQLRRWLVEPLADLPAIEARHDAVAALVDDRRMAETLGNALRGVQDVPRISARIGLRRAMPRDLVALGRSLGALARVVDAIDGCPALAAQRAALDDLAGALRPLAEEIERGCVDDPPAHLRDGGLFREGLDDVLDDARAKRSRAGDWLGRYQAQLAKEHELPSLKVGFNKVFGYYIELPAAQARRAPAIFTRKQTLKNAERYVTPELKTFEDEVLGAAESAIAREMELFHALCERTAALAPQLSAFAEAIATLDTLGALAGEASRRGWTRPEMTGTIEIAIEEGRHPVLDRLLGTGFVPNDIELGGAGEAAASPRLALITGPNMAGKSTFIRQVALLVLLAQAGSFVPARAARIGVVDRVFTRIGADDALHQGQSTFMVEMVETANILHNATPRSLVVLDEVGRGTSTLDGLALAWAITERLAGLDADADADRPRTLFATHYHELTELAEHHPDRVVNLHVAVREWGDEVVFLHRILPGRASRSFGVHVARLAGLPEGVVGRAAELLGTLSVSSDAIGTAVDRPCGAPDAQLGLFVEAKPDPALDRLGRIDIDRLSPLEAFDELRRLLDMVRAS